MIGGNVVNMSKLELFNPSPIKRMLCVVAHPDDMEYGASAAVAELTNNGVDVAYLLLTEGEAGIRDMPPQKTAALRYQEQREACQEVGVNELTVLNFPDGLVEAGQPTRKAIAEEIRRYKPDTVMITTWELEVPWGLNHVDHRNTAMATIDAIRDADNPWLFTELREQGLEPWGVDRLIVTGVNAPTHAIEVSRPSVEKAVCSLKAHKVYLESLTDHWDPAEGIPETLMSGGAAAGVDCALAVRIFPM